MIYASLVIIFNNKDEILLLKRSQKVDSHRGLWGFPGGKIEEDETSVEAAIREVKEETDLDIYAKELSYVFTMRKDNEKDIVFYLTNKFSGEVSIDWESEDFSWTKISSLESMEMVPAPKIIFDMIKAWADLFSSKSE